MTSPTSPLASDSFTDVQTAFISDVHLGSRYCQAERFLEFLNQYRFAELYIVGDFIDGWRLRRTWRWPVVYHKIFHRLLELQSNGTKLYYTPGNHDEFLRHYLRDYGFVNIADEFVHTALDGRRFLVTHGDKFDEVEKSCKWLSVVGASLYEFLLWTNYSFNQIRKLFRLPESHYSSAVKMRFKTAVNFISDFESKIAQHARNRSCEAIICGHIHAPVVQRIEEITYGNTGDWVEHCTALFEHSDGSWELKHFMPQRSQQSAPTEIAPEQKAKPHRSKSKGLATARQVLQSAIGTSWYSRAHSRMKRTREGSIQ